MEKNDITPIGCYGDSFVYEEFNKEELKEAGVVIDYVEDEVVECEEYKNHDDKRRRWWFRSLMFLFLVLSFLMIVGIGSARLFVKDSGAMEQVAGVYVVSKGVKEVSS